MIRDLSQVSWVAVAAAFRQHLLGGVPGNFRPTNLNDAIEPEAEADYGW
jgi:hypothetical protein